MIVQYIYFRLNHKIVTETKTLRAVTNQIVFLQVLQFNFKVVFCLVSISEKILKKSCSFHTDRQHFKYSRMTRWED